MIEFCARNSPALKTNVQLYKTTASYITYTYKTNLTVHIQSQPYIKM